MESAKDRLVGVVTKTGWQFIEKYEPQEGHTGGFFSTGYSVTRGNETAFAKALDLSEAFQESTDLISSLKERIDIIDFERFLLQRCRESRLSNVVRLLECDSIPSSNAIDTVYYFVFEKAEGDIRKFVSESDTSSVDTIFKLLILHDVATGLNQLHTIGIAHQDLKPSNVLVYEKVAKITDLGRSSSKEKPFIYDNLLVPGDCTYAPLDLLFGYRWSSDFSFRYAMDLYELGSLMLFLFCGYHMTPGIIMKAKITNFNESYSQIKPEIQRSIAQIVNEFDSSLMKNGFSESNRTRMKEMLRYLCSADPEERGNYHSNRNVSFNLQRYISEFDLLLKRAQQGQL